MRENNIGLHILLFVLTFLTVTFSDTGLGILFSLDSNLISEVFQRNWLYSVPLMIILFGHEMGHYLAARYYGIKATLPYFIPFPMGPIGTMGAVIQIREKIKNKKQLFDIGVAGPVVSLVLSVPAYIIGLYYSQKIPLALIPNLQNQLFFGDSFFTYFSAQWILGSYNPAQMDFVIHPLGKAGWVGLLVTAINLLPFGQLDGGHVIYALRGESYRKWIYYLFSAFLLICLLNFGWILWGFIILYLIKVEHPYVPDSPFPLDKNRKRIGYFMLASLVFIFVINPIYLGAERLQPDAAQKVFQWFGELFS